MPVQQGPGTMSLLSPAYIAIARPTCLRLLRQFACTAFCLALANAGNNSAARMAMMAMTTSSSMRVNARVLFRALDAAFDTDIFDTDINDRSEEHTSELQSRQY